MSRTSVPAKTLADLCERNIERVAVGQAGVTIFFKDGSSLSTPHDGIDHLLAEQSGRDCRVRPHEFYRGVCVWCKAQELA